MEIIPVIDVMGGKVVHAQGGDRANYLPLHSVLTNSHQPLPFISDLLNYHSFSKFYLADLDAIENAEMNTILYDEISYNFPEIEFYLDAGIRNKDDWYKVMEYTNIYPVIGSETLVDISWLDDVDVQHNSILSLDFKHKQFLGDQQLLSQIEKWTKQVIVMNIDSIASSSGPDFELLTMLNNKSDSIIIAAGGVRSAQDLIDLQQQGIEYVLVASALYDGRLTRDDFS